LKEASANEARCFLSLRTERAIHAFDAHPTDATSSLRPTLKSTRARRDALDVFFFLFSSVGRVKATRARSYQIENGARRKTARDRRFRARRREIRRSDRSARIL
jgi:hypothetical protein